MQPRAPKLLTGSTTRPRPCEPSLLCYCVTSRPHSPQNPTKTKAGRVAPSFGRTALGLRTSHSAPNRCCEHRNPRLTPYPPLAPGRSHVTPGSFLRHPGLFSQVQAARRVRPRRTFPSRPGHLSGMGRCCYWGLGAAGGCVNVSSSPDHHPLGHARLGGCVEERAAARDTDAPYGPQTD